jgi:hypothetical protein
VSLREMEDIHESRGFESPHPSVQGARSGNKETAPRCFRNCMSLPIWLPCSAFARPWDGCFSSDVHEGAAPVVLISHELWQERLAALPMSPVSLA